MLFHLALRKPNVILGGARPYMRRWYLTRQHRLLNNIYLHHILRSDDDRALHDHPWWNVSVVLRGGYYEWTPAPWWVEPMVGATVRGAIIPRTFGRELVFIRDWNGVLLQRIWRGPGSIVFRRAEQAHRLELPRGKTAWTLFITGKKTRDWGFHCPKGWKFWRDFIDCPTGEPTGAEVGPGCND